MGLQTLASSPFPIVSLGASAGGIEALQMFFEALPEPLGVAFIIVHLAPEYSNQTVPLLARKSPMPVAEVNSTLPLKANHVYVTPPGRQPRLTDTEVGAFAPAQPLKPDGPIDGLFCSLAQQHGDGYAIILSGNSSDGAVGIKAVKEQGGIILVQAPQEARFGAMPRAAIATGAADIILPLRPLARRLAELTKRKQQIYRTLAAAAGSKHHDHIMLERIFAHPQGNTGHHFSQHPRPLMLRRLARRMQLHGKETPGSYFSFLHRNPEEAQALAREFSLSGPAFFRNPTAWEALRGQVIPRLFEQKKADASLRLWVPGCATGEEAYSLAILLYEEAERRGEWPEIQIFATDLDKGALATAREGRYPAAIAADLSETRLRQFFRQENGHYCISREIQDWVLFTAHGLLRDPPFSRFDFISCRRLLIYLDRGLREQAFGILSSALHPGGYLFLGASENAEGGQFRTLNGAHSLFQVRPGLGREGEAEAALEKLHAANETLKRKLGKVSRAHSALENFMTAAEIGTLFLDRSLRIYRFTPPATKLFSITPDDYHRPITDFSYHLDYDRLEADARQVLRQLTPIEREIRHRQGQWYLLRLHPYQGLDGRNKGLILTFVDITLRKQAEEALRRERARLEAILQQLPVGVIIAEAPSGKLIFGNEQVAQIWKHDFIASENLESYQAYRGFHSNGDPYGPHDWPLARAIESGETVVQEEIRFQRGDDSFGWMAVSSAPIRDSSGKITLGAVAGTGSP